MLRILDEQIREHRQPVIELKRTQNLLLNVSRLPPEILGYIFWLSSPLEGFEKNFLNFLSVCFHWYEVALRTPELWSSWGNTLQDWKNRHLRHPEAPLDLVLDGRKPNNTPLDAIVRDTLRDRASRDTIRLVHLRSEDWELLSSVLGALATDREGVRHNRLGSFILQNKGDRPVDVSKFFANTRFPKLRHLDLTHCTVSSWGDLIFQTTLLTMLVLHLSFPSFAPTAPQLLLLKQN